MLYTKFILAARKDGFRTKNAARYRIQLILLLSGIHFTDTTTEDTTASTTPSTSPVPCQPCTGGGGLNRTNMALGGRCGVHGVDGKCTVPNSACMQSSTDTTWKCRCAQGYAEKNSNCSEIPNRLFSSQQKTVTIEQSTFTGSTVTTILFSGVSGFSSSNLTASVIGQGSSIFNVDVNANGATLKLNGKLDQYNYIIILTASVTIDNFVVRDFVEIRISVTPDTLIRDDIVIVDGTPEGSVVGQLCQSCFAGSDVISTSISNIVKVNSDGSIVTSKAINLDTIQNDRTIAYSTNILVHKNSNPIGNLTVIVIRSQYTLSLSEDSTSSTQVGVVNLDQPFTINADGLSINGQILSLGSTTLNYEGETELEKKLLLTISGTKQHSLDVSVKIKVQDVNDEAPNFLHSTYNFLTIQSAYSNLVVGVVTAQDSDLDSDLKYSLAENDFLTIDDYGVIRVKQSINRANYTVIVSVTDSRFTDSALVSIAVKNSNRAEIPNRLFSSQQKTVTIEQSTSTGSTVTTILFSGVSGFSSSNLTASVIGQGSSIFNVDVNANGATLKLNGKLDQYNYIIILTASVTIDNFVVRDFVEIRISVTPDTLIRDDIVIVDGTPEGSVVGQLCQSCFAESDVISTSFSNIVKVNSDGSIVTSKAINLDTIQNVRAIAYSTNILVHKNSNPTGNLTVIVIRSQYTLSLSEDSTSSTQVGVVNLDQPFTINGDGLSINGQTLSLGSTTLNYEGETELEKKLLLTIYGTKQHSLDVSVTIKVLDVNDEAPRFLKRTYNFLTIQSAYSNLVVGVVTAQDSDLDSDLKYSLAENDFLTIDDYGVIRVKQSINQANYTVIVSVTDSKFIDSALISIAVKNSNCAEIPNRLFSSQQKTVTIEQSTSTGSTVTTILFSGVSGFSSSSLTASVIGQGSSIFNVDVNANGTTLKLNGKLDQYNYIIILTASVTIDNFVVRDFVEIRISVTPDTLIIDDIVIVDGTPEGSVVGQLCQSCFAGSDVISTSISNIVKVNSDGSIVTSKAINLDTIQNDRTIAYSTNILVHTNSNPLGNLTVIVIRPKYTLSLSEDSTSSTQVGVVNLDQPFTINADGLSINGQTLSLGSTTLNYEGETELEKKLLLTIYGTKQHSLDVSVTIKVLDVNDESPGFLKRTFNFLTIQSAYSNLVVGVVTAQDSDLDSDLKYSLAENDFLTINDYGVIRIKQSIGQANYTVIVSVTDSKFTDSASVSIDLLQPVNVNLENKFTWNIPENGISNKSVHVADYKNFHFTDQMAHADFTLDPTTGVIQNRRQFDRENPQEKEFKYTVVANKKNEATCSLVIIGEITITITDVNDETPVFVNTPYTATVKEESSGEALVMNPISTTDEDEAPTVTYSLLNNAGKFSIISNTGVITTIAPLDREQTPTLTVGVKAYDGVNSATVIVTVTIEDVNDNNPVFTGTPYQFEIIENSDLKTVIGSVAVNDADEGKNAEINFEIISNGGFFRINQTSGEITLSRNIDRESTPTQKVTIYARDNGENIRSTSMTITINVKDVNDNAPVFAENYITVEFEEGKACNNPVTTIVATDIDEPNTLNSLIKYSVISGSEHVEIGQSSGVLRCKSPFDHENVSSVTILIKAEDSPNDGKLSSNQTVIINVKDINDNTPVFVDPKSTVTIRYFTNGRVVEVVNVADSDSGENGQVDLTISGSASSFLTIDNNGIIRTKGTQTDGTYSLVMTATDRGVPPKSDSHTMQIKLESSITQPISFSQQEINMNIEENSVTNTDVESVAPKVNKPDGVTVKYEIIDEKDDLPFQVHLDTGMVTVKSAIDRESRELHEFVLRVANTVTAEQSDLALVKVQLLDVNDNPPIFEQSEYFYNVREDVTANTAVAPNTIKIKASDADTGENALITFEILPGLDSCIAKFDLKDEGASIKSIVLSETIDYESYQTCKFSIKAYNQNKQTMSSTVTVDVNILDYNDNTPEFLGHTNGVYSIFIPEDTTINTEISLIGELQDKDSRGNADIELINVNTDCLFDVNNYDNKIRLQLKSGANIDYETGVRTNECTIMARDKGSPSLSATAAVNITIADVNDNRPLINQPDIKTNVSRDAVNGDVVVNRIPATDADSSENGQLIYSMKMSEYSSKFIINPDTGQITVNSPISSVQADQITIRAIVSDKGTPPLSSTATVTIKIIDDNPRPYLEQPSPINIPEHSQRRGGEIETVKAFDRVHGLITVCDCRFRLDTNRDDLTIDNETGVIKFKDIDDSFDREREPNSEVSVSVIAQDKANPPKDSQPMVITINILDINDQYPFFTQRIYNFNVFQKALNGSSIGTVAAIDKDINPVTHYSMNITEVGFDPSVVSINPITGEITKTGNLTLDQTTNKQIKGWVYAQDNKDPDKQPDVSQVIITIEFDDKNKHTPIFHKNLYTPILSWDADVDHLVVKVSAADNDTGVEGDVTYSISSGNNRGFFKVDNAGTVLLAYKLDSSIGSSSTEIVNLIITATDGGIISKFSKTTVRIRITGSNPGSCIQSLSHQNALDLVEGERDSWTIALFIVVALLCVAILCSLIFLYKWRISTVPPVIEPFDTDHKLKYVSNESAYSDLEKRQTVEYSHSNEGFIPPDPYNTPTDIGEVELEPRPDYPAYEWASDATRVLPTRAPTSFGSSS